MKSFVFVGLGNPGKDYALNRHNLGFLLLEEFARQLKLVFHEDKSFQCMMAKGRLNETSDVTVHLLLPLTYMNASGQAVRRYLDYFKMIPSQVVVVCDDVTLPLGQLRLRRGGSSGGHNGLKSVSVHLQTENFTRLKVGVGSKLKEQSLSDYVLSNFSSSELVLVEESIRRGVSALEMLTLEPMAKVMSQFNKPLL